ncbi:hypothetical protein QTP70_001682 [Hemibagrus guttatus]|uniref:DUF4939 domain-containing protein n=1 Tax=Hemibagrus guttatus TaxID=175788 RepID=A0AAE0Q4A5_9TELE|nr:hypothetical protein QTP70_001682 [Hemibagrus guttatus]
MSSRIVDLSLRMDPNHTVAGEALQNTLPTVDPTEYVHLQAVIARQGAIIHAYQEQLAALQAAQATPPANAYPVHSELVFMALPEKFDGPADCCRGFLQQCDNFFVQQPGVYREEATKCAFLLSLLTGKALDWASAVWDHDPQSWNYAALLAVFREGLNSGLQAEMACRDTHSTLSEFITTTICLDNLLCQRHRGPRLCTELQSQEEGQSSREDGPEPMQLGHTRTSQEE